MSAVEGRAGRFARAVVATEVHLERGPDDALHTSLPTISYDYFARFLAVSDEVLVVARVKPGLGSGSGAIVEGEGVRVLPVPYYHGLGTLVRRLPALGRWFARLPRGDCLYVGRIPETISLLLYSTARTRRIPFLAFLVADPVAALPRPGTADAAKRRLVRSIVRHCAGVVYVSSSWLQRLYPAPPGIPTLARSNVELPPAAMRARDDYALHEPARLVFVGTMGSVAKGQDALIAALGELRRAGRLVELTLVGDGPMRPGLEDLALREGVADHVRFVGATASAAQNWHVIDEADVYVSGSRAEGLPRAVIEAMARGLPVVATDAGATRELLEPDLVVPIDDRSQMVAAIGGLLDSEPRRATAGRANFQTAEQIRAQTDISRFTAFLREVAGSIRAGAH